MAGKKVNVRTAYPTEAELRELDQEFVADTFRRLSKASRLRWERLQSGATVDVPIDTELVKKLDALAKKRRVSRETLIAKGLEAMLQSSGVD